MSEFGDELAAGAGRGRPGHRLPRPAELSSRVRGYLGYARRLLDGRMTLAEHCLLLVVVGWLSLLAAKTLIDLHRDHAAAACLRTAAQLARETGHAEIAAWCLETQAWQVLTGRDYRRAVDISRAAQQVAPKSGRAFIQATAQEGRAWARLGDACETRAALGRVEALVSPLPVPDRPEHHYQYDPAKSEAYTATTLAWIGDPAAERYARHVLARLESSADGPLRPRRAESARLDLSLALIAAGRHDEAAGTALEAITSGRIVPSNYWRARKVIQAVAERGVPEAAELARRTGKPARTATARRSLDHLRCQPVMPVRAGSLAGWPNGTMTSAGTRTRRQLLPPQAPSSGALSLGQSGPLSARDSARS